ncbi:DUF6420 family protein [Streptomyces sp. NPDC050610]|uniref:DUF6420 family protein n=1 Tax=Streptomyces sp. NPDC050610 TaxID=3157097 RepID=UPI003449A20D
MLRRAMLVCCAHCGTGAVAVGCYITSGGGRLTVKETGGHFGCPNQRTEKRNADCKRLGQAAEGHCLHAGCRHLGADTQAAKRTFRVRSGSIDLTAFARASLAVELGDGRPAALLLQATEALVGLVRREGPQTGQAGTG